ncbi:MAG TPA: hypothetical protein VJJ26_03360 [Candidatus Babeliales bacterium]|nr:hypothetical protein [Candidatus Babeliales bacterium]
MKKNILLVQSLLILPLISSSILLSMGKPTVLGTENKLTYREKLETPINRSKSSIKREKKRQKQQQALKSSAEIRAEPKVTAEPTAITQTVQITPIEVVMNSDIDQEILQFLITEQETQIAEELTKELSDVIRKLEQLAGKEDLIKILDALPVLQTKEKVTEAQTAPVATETVYTTTPANEAIETEAVVADDVIAMLAQSVMLPQETKDLGYLESAKIGFAKATGRLRYLIISALVNESFDVKNALLFDLLNDAVTEATAKNDFDSLEKLVTLSETGKYKGLIRISDATARAAFESCCTHHKTQIDTANLIVQKTNDSNAVAFNTQTEFFKTQVVLAMDMYQREVQKIAVNGDKFIDQQNETLKKQRALIATLGCLNQSIRKEASTFLTQNSVTVPKNIVTATQEPSDQRIKSILNRSNIPTIAIAEKKQDILQIDNK